MSKDIRVFQGNSIDLVFKVTDPKGAVFNLDGVTAVRFGIATSPKRDAYKVHTLKEGVLISDKAGGVITVQLGAEDTAEAGCRVYELTVEFGKDVYTAAAGALEIVPSILA